MPRPLRYSTPQRIAQYNTVRTAGLSKPDYNSAINRLNQMENKYRTAQKLKERREREAEEERARRAQEAAAARAEALRESERKKRAEKNKKRREKRAAQKAKEKADKILASKNSYIQTLVDNMRNRVGGTYDMKEARDLGISDLDLLERIARNSDNGMWKLGVVSDEGEQYYTLSDTTRTRLAEYIKANLTAEQASDRSDADVVSIIKIATYFQLTPIEPVNKNKKANAKFFKYHNKTNIDLTRCGIWSETIPSNYDDTCLVLALINGGLSVKKQEIIKRMIKNRSVPFSDIQKICNAAQIQIKIKTEDTANNSKRVFGKEYDEVYNIGCLIEHYFIIEPVEYTSYCIKNYLELKDKPNFNQIYGMKKTTYMRDEKHYIDTFDIIKLMLQNKDIFFTEITLEDKYIASTQFYDKVTNEIVHLDYDVEKCIRPIEPIKRFDQKEKQPMQNLFFDFETNPTGEHKAYLCRTYDGKSSREFIGENCGLQMLFSLKRNTRLIAHNATYDFRFIIQYLRNVSELARGNKLISAKGRFNDVDIEIKDSYHLITMPLRSFPKVFGIENTIKEVMPYTLYNEENINKRFVPIQDALALVTDDEKEQFMNNIKRWDLQVDDTYDIIKYSSNYCEIDCKILHDGYNTFRKWITQTFKLDIDVILTGASLAHQYFVNEGCYEGVNELGGIPQLFIQGCVVGGRVMCAENKKMMLDYVINDFDAVSLYPSAMFRMDGFLKGVPKVIENHDFNWIKNQDGYFIDITINSVGIKRKFPLMSYKNESGVRVFTNDMIGRTIRVDRYTLEDIIKFQDITFSVVRGYYFDEGFNTKVRNVITTIFNKRLVAKKEKNPIEMVYKLIMNSGYGKSIMKPVETESKFFDTYESEDEFNVYLSRNYNWITSFVKFGNKIKVNTVKTLIDHFNIAQVGVCILSNSKRIMNEVMCLAEDNNIDLYYQDTDSMHLRDEHIPILSKVFKETYGRELIGKGLGQFHSDFDLPGCSNIVATKSIFLGKKCYIDKLEGTNKDGEKESGFHIRMKGIPEKCIHYVVENTPKYKDAMDLYIDLYNGAEVVFDLTNGGSKANFKFNKNYTINTLSMFNRSIKF
jgi:hypothetical protein